MRSINWICRTVLLGILLAVPTLSLAFDEEAWIRTYRGGYGHSVFPTPDGGGIVGGSFGAGLGTCCQPSLMKLHPDGSVQWQKMYDGRGFGGANNIEPTIDGGYVMAIDGTELRVAKVDADGNLLWAKTYGDGGYTHGRVFVTPDDTYLVYGATKIMDNGFFSNGRALMLDRDGNVLWQKIYGRFNSPEYFTSATMAYNGNYIIAGMFQGDYWVLELDHSGNVVWQYTYGGPYEDTGLVVTRVLDDHYLVVGASDTYSEGGMRNWWAVLLDQSGKVYRQFTIGGLDAEDPHTAIATSDGGFMIGGGTGSFGVGFSDLWLVKFDSRLRVEWQRAYGKEWRTDHAWQIHELPSGYAVVGDSYYFPTDYDIWLMTVDHEGNVLHGGCGSVTDTTATPKKTNAKAQVPDTATLETDVKAASLKVSVTSPDWPVESCSPAQE